MERRGGFNTEGKRRLLEKLSWLRGGDNGKKRRIRRLAEEEALGEIVMMRQKM